MDYETEKMLDDIKNEIYNELDELRSLKGSRPQSYADVDEHVYQVVQHYRPQSYGAQQAPPKKEWREYWAKYLNFFIFELWHYLFNPCRIAFSGDLGIFSCYIYVGVGTTRQVKFVLGL